MKSACLKQNREVEPPFSPVGFIFTNCLLRSDSFSRSFLLNHLNPFTAARVK